METPKKRNRKPDLRRIPGDRHKPRCTLSLDQEEGEQLRVLAAQLGVTARSLGRAFVRDGIAAARASQTPQTE